MELQDYYRLWLNYKQKRRIVTEKRIKGKCELRARHWKLLEIHWAEDFFTIHPPINFKLFLFYVKYHPHTTLLADNGQLIRALNKVNQPTI